MTSENIRNYCEEALDIAEQQEVYDGLAFLIGEKFSLVYYQLKTAHNKLKYLYPDSTPGNQNNPILKENKALKLSYTLTINENYRDVIEQISLLEEVLGQFIEEIKKSFSLENIQDYLDSYPRLAFKEHSPPHKIALLEKNSPMTTGDVFSELEDILIVDEMKKLFT